MSFTAKKGGVRARPGSMRYTESDSIAPFFPGFASGSATRKGKAADQGRIYPAFAMNIAATPVLTPAVLCRYPQIRTDETERTDPGTETAAGMVLVFSRPDGTVYFVPVPGIFRFLHLPASFDKLEACFPDHRPVDAFVTVFFMAPVFSGKIFPQSVRKRIANRADPERNLQLADYHR